VIEHLHPDRSSSIWSGFKQFPEVVSTSVQYGIKNHVIFILLLSSLALGIGGMGLEVLWQPQVKGILGSDSQRLQVIQELADSVICALLASTSNERGDSLHMLTSISSLRFPIIVRN
jgi:hypothetical protein